MLDKMIIPNTDLRVSRIAFGTAQAGLRYDGYEADALFNRYLDLGGNLIDTARVYNEWVPGEIGRSERVIGDWLRREKKRQRVILMTKGGHPPLGNLHQSRMHPEEMQEDLDRSLLSLGVDEIDIYFYHRDDENQSVASLLDVMEHFRRQGKIRFYACSNWSTARMQEADAYARKKILRGFIANQVLYNAGSAHMRGPSDDTLQVMDKAMQAYHKQNHRCVAMPYTSQVEGFFHQILYHSDATHYEKSDYFTDENVALAYMLQDLMKKYHASLSQVLLGYLLSRSFSTIPIIGCSKKEHLEDAMASLKISFYPDDFKSLE